MIYNNNTAFGLAATSNYKVGKSDTDEGLIIEENVRIPTVVQAEASWVYYDCSIHIILDSGIVVHNRLPQSNNAFDTLSIHSLDDAGLDTFTGRGINLKCKDQYQDIVQRMGHARYWFLLRGQALRIGYQIPIPSIKTIGGVAAIPYDKNPQWAHNSIVPGGNYSGTVLWRADWSLWYTTLVPPTSDVIPALDPAAHIGAVLTPPTSIQSPYSQADDNATTLAGVVR
jgi:hypothetical protein